MSRNKGKRRKSKKKLPKTAVSRRSFLAAAGSGVAAAMLLEESHGETQAARIRLGVTQVAERWWAEDGDVESFSAFCNERFIVDEKQLHETFLRLQDVMEQIDGHLHEVRRELTTPMQLDTGPVSELDQLLGGIDLTAHVDEDLYTGKVAFVTLLNFPIYTLAEVRERATEPFFTAPYRGKVGFCMDGVVFALAN